MWEYFEDGEIVSQEDCWPLTDSKTSRDWVAQQGRPGGTQEVPMERSQEGTETQRRGLDGSGPPT